MPPDKDQLRLQVEKVSNLPTLPGIVTRIAEMVDSPETTGRQLGREIAKDQVISAKVLKLVNSGFYGFSEPISTIQHAVTLLGFNTVKSLVLSSTVLDLMKDSLPGLWEHSLACARTCSIIAGHIELDEQEEISTAGLLHDLGKVILRQTMEREFRRIANYVDRADMLFYQAEEKVLGVNHGEMGGWLLEKWALPPKLVEPIVDHHDFRPNRDYAENTAILHLADILCRAQAFGSGGDRKIPRLAPSALETLKLTIDDVCEIMGRMHEELRDIPRM
ncbi:HDOD domain-containing protein [bacterium]|mgnify:FL=1|nr:HD family phosphohydrolase [Gemmatimonadota bacterium]MCH2660997.1 HDOD domain-containing protein [bacterium]|tara:strand:- start:27 stop:854 length:828 start_codon:yes stop_codon:yes gene_type:complete